jgi:hypothetical protein
VKCISQRNEESYELIITGASADEVYVLCLWYYDFLAFLTDQELRRKSKSNAEEDEEEKMKKRMYV